MYPDVRQGPVIAKLSLARAVAREAELAALTAFPPAARRGTAPPARADLAHALNRISSALYLLRLPLRRRPLRGRAAAARAGPRLEATPPAREDPGDAGSGPPSPSSRRGWPRSTTTRSSPPTRARFGGLLLAHPALVDGAPARAWSRSAARPAT